MSTEKDREVVIAIAARDRGTDDWTANDILDNHPAHPWYPRIKEVVGFVEQGIQHARQGERALLKRFRDFQDGYRKVVLIDEIKYQGIDEFLEQEKTR